MTYQAPELVQVGVATDLVLGGASSPKKDSTAVPTTFTSPNSLAVLGLDE